MFIKVLLNDRLLYSLDSTDSYLQPYTEYAGHHYSLPQLLAQSRYKYVVIKILSDIALLV